jgi:hypothetical protein
VQINFGDPRSFKIAVVADYYVNSQNYPKLPNAETVYNELRDAGYGIIKMPSPAMIGKGLVAWITSTVDQIQEYSNRGFAVFVLGVDEIAGKGVWLPDLKQEIKKRGIPLPKSIILKKKQIQTDARPYLAFP